MNPAAAEGSRRSSSAASSPPTPGVDRYKAKPTPRWLDKAGEPAVRPRHGEPCSELLLSPRHHRAGGRRARGTNPPINPGAARCLSRRTSSNITSTRYLIQIDRPGRRRTSRLQRGDRVEQTRRAELPCTIRRACYRGRCSISLVQATGVLGEIRRRAGQLSAQLSLPDGNFVENPFLGRLFGKPQRMDALRMRAATTARTCRGRCTSSTARASSAACEPCPARWRS